MTQSPPAARDRRRRAGTSSHGDPPDRRHDAIALSRLATRDRGLRPRRPAILSSLDAQPGSMQSSMIPSCRTCERETPGCLGEQHGYSTNPQLAPVAYSPRPSTAFADWSNNLVMWTRSLCCADTTKERESERMAAASFDEPKFERP
jgi:hypothetical protein